MSGVYGVLQIGARSIFAHQKGIEVAGHNIANVNTPGYSRQKVSLQTGMPVSGSQGMVGTGVIAGESQRIYDRFVGTQIQNENEELGRWDAQKTALERVEIIIDESSDDGLSKTMGEFWNAWQDLTNNPSGNVERMALLGSSETLAFKFQNAYNNLSPLQHNLDFSITATVDEINLKAAEIAELNQRVLEAEGGGAQANDFRDSRDLAVNDLSLMIDVDSYEDDIGSINVNLKSGDSLVNGSGSSDLATIISDSGHKDVVWASDPTVSINSKISGGKLKGWFEVRDVTIPEYKRKMEDLVNGIKGVESTEVITGAASTLSGGEYFTISSPTTPETLEANYCVWYKKETVGTNPALADPTLGTGIEVAISTGDTAAQVASKTAEAIAAQAGSVFDVSVTGGSTLTIANAVAGVATDSADSAVSGKETGFAITKRIDGGEGVNYFHRKGYGLDDSTGNDFFSGTLAGNNFAVDATIAADSSSIAAAADTGLPGDNSNAIAIAELQNALMMNANTTTFDDYYHSMVSDVGTEVRHAGLNYDHHTAMVGHLENYRESISGVSLDEEMVNLMQFQLGYDAAAKLISTTDEMLETLLNMV
jgi:flagellar hook-associated protein 1